MSRLNVEQRKLPFELHFFSLQKSKGTFCLRDAILIKGKTSLAVFPLLLC
jgi:hypothetical protein